MPLVEKEGTFLSKVKAAAIGESSNGKPFLQMTFECAEGSIAKRFYLSDAAWDFSMKTLKEVFGFDGDFMNLSQFEGKECSIVTENEADNNGEQRLQVKWVNSPGGPKMDEGDRKSLAERLNAKAKSEKTAKKEESGDDSPPF